MIIIPRNKVAVVPIFDAKVSRGGIIKPSSFIYTRDVQRFDIYGTLNYDREPRKIDECESKERSLELINRYENAGYIKLFYKIVKVKQDSEMLDAGERCDQGIVKYIGREVKDIKIGDYVFFGGYTGTRMYIEDEGDLIILPENFVECVLEDVHIKIPGLYFKDKQGEYFVATYEQVMNIVAETFTLLNETVEIKVSIPKLEDYNVR